MPGFTYKSYSFIDKDPIIDEVRSAFIESGTNYTWIHEHSGVTAQTLHNWFNGKTKKPQAATINAVLRAMGYKLGIVELRESQIVHIDPPMKPASVRHVVQMARYRRVK